MRIKLLTSLGCLLFYLFYVMPYGLAQRTNGSEVRKTDELFERGFALINKDVKKADSLIEVAWRMAYSKKDAKGIADGFFYKGCVYDRMMMVDSAIYYLENALERYIPEEAWGNVPDAYGRIGLLKFKKSEIQDGLEYLMNGIEVAEIKGNKASVVRLSIVLAMHHNDYTGQYNEAITYLAKAERSALKLKDTNLLGHIYLQYSLSYQNLGLLDDAEKYALKSSASFREINSTYNEVRALFCLGSVYRDKRESDELLKLLVEVKQMMLRVPDDLLQANYDKLYAEAVFQKGQYKEALSYAMRSASQLEKGGISRGVIDLNKLKSRIYYSLGNLEKADSLFFIAEAAQDSMFSDRAYTIDSDLRQKYDSEAKEQKIALQHLEIVHGQTLRNGLIGLLLLLVALAIMLHLRIKEKRRLNKLNELLLNEVNHRIKNNLQLLSSILSMQNRKLVTQEAKDLVKKCVTWMRTFSLIHDTLYMQNSMDNIDMKNFLSQLCSGNATINEEKVRVNIETNEVQLSVDFAMHIGLIMNELVTNTYKYAFNQQAVMAYESAYDEVMVEQGAPVPFNEINISLKQVDLMLEISYQDSGPGMDENPNPMQSKQMGMKLIYGLVSQMQGTITYNKDKSQFLIHLKNKLT